MSDLNDIKAGDYQLVAETWDEPKSKPGEPFDFVRHRKGDVVTLGVEEARRLVSAGAVVKPGEVERQAAEQARLVYEAALAQLPDAVRAEVTGQTSIDTDGSGGSAFDVSGNVEDILAAVGEDADLAEVALQAETARGDKARSTLTEKLAAIVAAGS